MVRSACRNGCAPVNGWLAVLVWGVGVVLAGGPVMSFAQDAPAKAAAEAPKGAQPVEIKTGGKSDEVTYAHIELSGALTEGAALPGLFGELSESLGTVKARIEKVATDPKVAGLILKLNGLQVGPGQLSTFRSAIGKVRAAGKKVHCYLDDGTNLSYLVAAACDEVVMPQPSLLMLVGLRAEVSFYKNLFEMIGVQADMLRVGAFKSAAEPYTRSNMSPEFKQEMDEILDDRFRQLVEGIAKARNLSVEKVKELIDQGPQTSKLCKEGGLIDRIGYEDELESGIEQSHPGKKLVIARKYGKKKLDTDFSGFTGMVKMMELIAGVEPAKSKSKNPKIAIIYATGPIMTGSSQSDLFGETTMGSDTMIKAIREAAKDDTVKTVVLRVNSPGGSALASDLMWRELNLLKAKKPLIVSMGDVAASGGYYIAMGANTIFAEAGTITGSIGVLGGKLALGGVYEKIGINTTVLTRGKNAGIFSTTTPFNDTERKSMQAMLDDIYAQFTTKAAAGRKMEVEALEKLARGRIYTGEQAKKIGLIDEVGSLEDAIAAAKKSAGLDPAEKLELLELPKHISPFEQLLGPIDAAARTNEAGLARLLGDLAPQLAPELRRLRLMELFARERALLLMPYSLRIE
jgi:protease-4